MLKFLYQTISTLYNSKKLPWIIMGVGVFLRLVRYMSNPSLWFDEARYSLGILEGSISEFVSISSNYSMTSPFGFYAVEKFFVNVFGNSEYVLRLFPLLCSVVSLYVFYLLAKRYISPKAVPVALGLFAILEPFVYYSAEVKPYSSDILVVLLLYLLFENVRKENSDASALIPLGIVSTATILLSHPALFVLAGIGLVFLISALLRKHWSLLIRFLMIYIVWAASFLTIYYLFTAPQMEAMSQTNNDIFFMKQNAFMPLPPSSVADIQWFINILFETFRTTTGITVTGIAVLAFLVGGLLFHRNKKETFYLLLTPAIFALLASGLHKYAFQDRAILFLTPLLLFFVAEGVESIREKISGISPVAGFLIVGLLFLHPISWAAYHVAKPNSREEIKPVLNYIKQNLRNGDIVYVYYMAQFAVEYYTKYYPDEYGFNGNSYIIGKGPRDWYATYNKKDFKGFWDENRPFAQPYTSIFKEYTEDLEKLSGHKRVWILFASDVPKAGINEEKFFIYQLETMGKQLDFFGRANNASVYLYDMTKNTVIIDTNFIK